MGIKKYIKIYVDTKKRGDHEEVLKLKYKMEKGARGALSRYTQGKPLMSSILAVAVRVFESKESKNELKRIMEAYHYTPDRFSRRSLRRINRDIYFSEFNYRIDADEYFRYNFENLSTSGRRSYVGSTELVEGFHKIADPEAKAILSNKYKAYCYFKPYFKRDAILVSNRSDLDNFKEFCSNNNRFFIKPLSKYGGQGVRYYELTENENLEKLLESFVENGPVIIEQPIKQALEMAKFHPQSINTVRIVTAYLKDHVEIVQSSVRLGTGDSVVDNGCLSAAIDSEMGIICTPGRVAHGSGLYFKHPDTGIQILGSEIPAWEELISLAHELAKLLEKQRIIGWDFAYSVDGWIVVEANSAPSIQILAGNGTGMRPVFEKITR